MRPIMGFFSGFAKRNSVDGVIPEKSEKKDSGCTVQTLGRKNERLL